MKLTTFDKVASVIIAIAVIAFVSNYYQLVAWQKAQETETVVKYCSRDGKIDMGLKHCQRYVLGTLTAEDKAEAQANLDKKMAAYQEAQRLKALKQN